MTVRTGLGGVAGVEPLAQDDRSGQVSGNFKRSGNDRVVCRIEQQRPIEGSANRGRARRVFGKIDKPRDADGNAFKPVGQIVVQIGFGQEQLRNHSRSG